MTSKTSGVSASIAMLGDLSGPKLRLTEVKGDAVTLRAGAAASAAGGSSVFGGGGGSSVT